MTDTSKITIVLLALFLGVLTWALWATQQASRLERVKAIGAMLLALGGFVVFIVLPELPVAVRILGIIGGVIAGAVAARFSTIGREFFTYVKAAHEEARKVVWPTRKETMQSTGAVFAFAVVMAIFLWTTDKSLEWLLYDLILGWDK